MATKTTQEIGPDGWPLDQPSEAEQAAKKERELQHALRVFKAQWEAGDLTAATKAVRALRAPGWLRDATDKLTVDAMAEQEKKDRRRWHTHRMRSEMFTELCGRRDELSRTAKANLERARAQIAVKPTDEKGAQERARLIEELPGLDEAAGYDWGTTNLERVREIVSKKLGEGHSSSAIKRSCRIVEAAGGEAATFESYLTVRRELGESDDD